jgi:hypothetical protein
LTFGADSSTTKPVPSRPRSASLMTRRIYMARFGALQAQQAKAATPRHCRHSVSLYFNK